MLLLFLLATSFFVRGEASACAANNNDPDGVREHLVFKSCSSSDVIQPTSITVMGSYPVSIHKPLYITVDCSNTGGTYNKLLVDVDIYGWSKRYYQSACTWNVIPTFGLLYNLDGCSVVNQCPLRPGTTNFEFIVDLSPYAQFLEGSLLSLRTRFLNGDNSQHEEIGCFDIEFLVENETK